MDIALPAALLLICAQAPANESKTVQIRIDGEPEFDVVYHRAKTNATGASDRRTPGCRHPGWRGSRRDSDKVKEIRPHIADDVWQNAFMKTLGEALQAKGFEPQWIVEGEADPNKKPKRKPTFM